MTTATETRIRFLTKFPDHELIIEPARKPRQMTDGTWTPGAAGRKIEFIGNEYVTADPAEIEFLRNHPLFNADIWEFGAAPGELKPTEREQRDAIIQASVARDVPALQKIKLEESETHNRATVIEAVESALRSIAGAHQEV